MVGFAIDPATDTFVPITVEIIIYVKSKDTIEDALSNIALICNNSIAAELDRNRATPAYLPLDNWPRVLTSYNAYHNEASIYWYTLPANNHIAYEIEPTEMQDGFFFMMNVPNVDYNTYRDYKRVCTQASPIAYWDFNNVWDREYLYLHASFVQYTNAQFLGEGGEWYPKPSKIYDFNTSSGGQFWVQVSFDGFRFVKLPHEHWKISLAFLANDKNYQAN
jgi:hypothetical protein